MLLVNLYGLMLLKINDLCLSNNTISRRINDIYVNIEEQIKN